MPIEIGTEGIGEVYVGNESIGQVYAGLDLVWSKTSAATFITGHSVSLSTNGTLYSNSDRYSRCNLYNIY